MEEHSAAVSEEEGWRHKGAVTDLSVKEVLITCHLSHVRSDFSCAFRNSVCNSQNHLIASIWEEGHCRSRTEIYN